MKTVAQGICGENPPGLAVRESVPILRSHIHSTREIKKQPCSPGDKRPNSFSRGAGGGSTHRYSRCSRSQPKANRQGRLGGDPSPQWAFLSVPVSSLKPSLGKRHPPKTFLSTPAHT